MINYKKGTGHSLLQSDKVASLSGDTIVAGDVVHVEVVGGVEVVKLGLSATDSTAQLAGFATRSTTDGDVISAKKLGVLLLDGNSVIETDRCAVAVNATNYPIGSKVTADATGKIITLTTPATQQLIGTVEGVRTLPLPTPTAMLGIKLA